MRYRLSQNLAATLVISASLIPQLYARTAPFPVIPAEPLITGTIDPAIRVTLTGDQPGWTNIATDNGPVPANQIIPHILVSLKRGATPQAALDQFITATATPGSADYHHWIAPNMLAALALAAQDLTALQTWFSNNGFSIAPLPASQMRLDLAGSTAAINEAFGTTLHQYTLNGTPYIAPASDPSLPAALAPVIAGVTLSNIAPTDAILPAVNLNGANSINGAPYVAPSDFGNITGLTAIFAGTSGFGVAVTGIGHSVGLALSGTPSAADWQNFRKNFGLAPYHGSLTLWRPENCASDGTAPLSLGANMAAQWAGLAAPDATILAASCVDSGFRPGVFAATEALIAAKNPPDAIAIPAALCESALGRGFAAAWQSLVEEAAITGISLIAASGNSGAGCDAGIVNGNETLGFGVNVLAASPYVLAAGGSDFADAAIGSENLYWHKRNPARADQAATSYVPETAFNNGCGNVWLSPQGECASSAHAEQQGVAGGGGLSTIFPQPSWQANTPGLPLTARALPDITLFAGNGLWNHFYAGCDHSAGQAPGCGNNDAGRLAQGAGGTAIPAAILAGIAADLAQAKGGKLGLLAPRLYQLAGKTQRAACAASRGRLIPKSCLFRTIDTGSTAIACAANSPNCVNQMLTATPPAPLATGLGSPNLATLMPAF
jgi:subtilase family serine protease